jgi:hypothetical protein
MTVPPVRAPAYGYVITVAGRTQMCPETQIRSAPWSLLGSMLPPDLGDAMVHYRSSGSANPVCQVGAGGPVPDGVEVVPERPVRALGSKDETSAEVADRTVLFRFVEAVAALPALRGDAERSAFVHLLRPEIALAVKHDQRARVYAFNLVQACLDHEGGLRELLVRLYRLEGDSLAMRRVLALATAIPGPSAEGTEGSG